MIDKVLGHATAYGYYKAGGGTMTEAEFTEFMADFGTASQTAVEAAQAALASKNAAQTAATTATNKASEATTAATTATNKAAEAQADADAAALDASQALSAASTATTKATEATTAAATAVSAKDDAVSANTAAQSAKAAAQTAQTGAETAAASVEASAAQIATNAEDISQLKSEFTALTSDGVVPSAGQILTDKGITDSVPYHYRKTGGDGADRLYDQIVGGTVCWNQLCLHNFLVGEYVGNGVTVKNNGDGSYTFYTDANGATADVLAQLESQPSVVEANHVYCVTGGLGVANVSKYVIGDYMSGVLSINGQAAGIVKPSNVKSNYQLDLRLKVYSGAVVTTPVTFSPCVFDLTAMFGTTIADYIYNLETAHTGDGVAFFKALFPNDYYPYNAGELVSVSGLSKHKMVGFNQWDEEWEIGAISDTTGENIPNDIRTRSVNYIPVVPNAQYYPKKGDTPSTVFVYWYNAEKTYLRHETQSWSYNVKTIPSDAYYMRFMYLGTTYNHDICINISDPAKNGQYEPYKAHSYPLDSTVELRGLFKLDANNNLYADGDTYEYTGNVTRNTILRAYQSGDESLANAITDGTNTVVYSANASTEQAEPYQHLQQCDPNGTEEYVSTGIVPVGHNSFYPENLRAKVEQLPWNFASLIAPTEATFTTTRNYTTGALFIVDNVLYKATSNIANGGTITPNTNCTATTLAEIISALA